MVSTSPSNYGEWKEETETKEKKSIQHGSDGTVGAKDYMATKIVPTKERNSKSEATFPSVTELTATSKT